MPASIRIVSMRQNGRGEDINCCSNSPDGKWAGLSPFLIGPCSLYDGHIAQNMENGWQFSKVYPEHASNSEPTDSYWAWAKTGWSDKRAHRYPAGKGRKPLYSLWLYSLWQGSKLTYVEARKRIYVPLYAKAVIGTQSWQDLKARYYEAEQLSLRDFDGYDHDALGMSLIEVLNESSRKMGHAFVLKMLLTNDIALKECGINN